MTAVETSPLSSASVKVSAALSASTVAANVANASPAESTVKLPVNETPPISAVVTPVMV